MMKSKLGLAFSISWGMENMFFESLLIEWGYLWGRKIANDSSYETEKQKD